MALPSFTNNSQQQDSYAGLSPLGTPMIDIITLSVEAHKTLDGTEIFYTATDGVGFEPVSVSLYAVNFTVTQPVNIVKTQISGRNGTIKEYINQSDYVIDCSAIITRNPPKTDNGQTSNIITAGVGLDSALTGGRVKETALRATNAANNIVTRTLISRNQKQDTITYNGPEIQKLNLLSKATIPLTVTSKVLNNYFGIRNCVMEDFEAAFASGTDVSIRFRLVSDVDFSLEDFIVTT